MSLSTDWNWNMCTKSWNMPTKSSIESPSEDPFVQALDTLTSNKASIELNDLEELKNDLLNIDIPSSMRNQIGRIFSCYKGIFGALVNRSKFAFTPDTIVKIMIGGLTAVSPALFSTSIAEAITHHAMAFPMCAGISASTIIIGIPLLSIFASLDNEFSKLEFSFNSMNYKVEELENTELQVRRDQFLMSFFKKRFNYLMPNIYGNRDVLNYISRLYLRLGGWQQ